MTATNRDKSSQGDSRGVSVRRLLSLLTPLALLLANSGAQAQSPPVHYFHSADLPPGTVGQGQLLRGGPLPGYFQPVEIQAPPGAKIALAVDGAFQQPQESPLLVGLLIGQVYRFRVTQIPKQEGLEVFPSIEVVNRLYPPDCLETHFPVPVQLAQEELELALQGNFVTRVIYLENPDQALAVRDQPGQQRYYDVHFDEDPLKVADRLGRPMAILRMGSRTPDLNQLPTRFTFASPPWQPLQRPAPLADPRSGLEEQPPGADADGGYPRWPHAAATPALHGRYGGSGPALR